ncbi:MAG: magnesium chelatase [Deltaproteobacteria bacterium]|nr:magnesium chelatase [Deltaproteobacteria bacterium]
MAKATTLGELRESGHRPIGVRAELRQNLKAALARGDRILPGLLGYEESVVPEVQNAILSGHHIILLGERGQGKSRLIRALVELLDESVPAVAGCEIHCDPLAPICRRCRSRLAAEGDALGVVWVERFDRYGEKLATPDVSMADLIGEIDPIKVAEGRYLADEDTIHYGLVPRSHRGIFAINELPDLMEKIQVGLFNLMEERDIQIRGFKVRLPVDVLIIASANPEDYTSRGRIVTPLKDRFDAQIRTHYPRDVETEIAIVEQEVPGSERDGTPVRMPEFMRTIVAQLTFEARSAGDINQGSGVSVRVSINNYETLIANAERRALLLGEHEIVPRISDLHAVSASMLGKLEFEYTGEERSEQEAFERLLNRAVLAVFDRTVNPAELAGIVGYFEGGWGVEVSDRMPATEYLEGIGAIPGLRDAISRLGSFESPALMAAATEFLLEGLHLHQKLNKEVSGGRVTYRV